MDLPSFGQPIINAFMRARDFCRQKDAPLASPFGKQPSYCGMVTAMANPQVENGRTEFANELMDVICRTYFSPAESKIFNAIARKTYGYHKKIDRIAYTQFEEMTELSKWHISPTIQRLKDRNMITVTGTGYTRYYGIQKDYDKWLMNPKLLPKSVTKKKLLPKSGVIQNQTVADLLPKSITNKNDEIVTDLGEIVTDLSGQVVTEIGGNKSNKAIYKSNIGKTDKKNITVLPDWINPETWEAFIKMRKKIKKEPTEEAIVLLIKKLERLKNSGNDPNDVLEQSIMNSWQGVFPLDDKKFQSAKQSESSADIKSQEYTGEGKV